MNVEIIKKHLGLIAIGIISISLDIMQKHVFFTQLFSYFLFIKLLFSDYINTYRKKICVTIWIICAVWISAGFYTNHYFPHGPLIDTGDVVCQNDDRGPCGESYIEDTRKLAVPDWVKFFRTSEAELLLFGLVFAGIIASATPQNKT